MVRKMIDSIWITNTEYQLNNVSCEVDTLQYRLFAIQDKTDMLSAIIETSNESISNQLSAATFWLEAIAIIIAIGGGILGYYVTRKKRQIEAIAQTIDEKKQIVDKVAKATEELDKKIHSDMTSLYDDLRKEETNALLDRLIFEPGDITNLIKQLFARDLDDEFYIKLKEAYLKLLSTVDDEEKSKKDTDKTVIKPRNILYNNLGYKETAEGDYVLLFFQHFCYLSIKDADICPSLVVGFGVSCNLAFKRDIIKSTIDLCKALSESDSVFNKEDVLTAYLKALNNSKHRNLNELRNIMEQNITPQALLHNAIERCTKDKVYLELFGVSKPENEDSQQNVE